MSDHTGEGIQTDRRWALSSPTRPTRLAKHWQTPQFAAHAHGRRWHRVCVLTVGAITAEIEGATDQD